LMNAALTFSIFFLKKKQNLIILSIFAHCS
jgi:hypothetical protein